jgi:hypothetical protein
MWFYLRKHSMWGGAHAVFITGVRIEIAANGQVTSELTPQVLRVLQSSRAFCFDAEYVAPAQKKDTTSDSTKAAEEHPAEHPEGHPEGHTAEDSAEDSAEDPAEHAAEEHAAEEHIAEDSAEDPAEDPAEASAEPIVDDATLEEPATQVLPRRRGRPARGG